MLDPRGWLIKRGYANARETRATNRYFDYRHCWYDNNMIIVSYLTFSSELPLSDVYLSIYMSVCLYLPMHSVCINYLSRFLHNLVFTITSNRCDEKFMHALNRGCHSVSSTGKKYQNQRCYRSSCISNACYISRKNRGRWNVIWWYWDWSFRSSLQHSWR